MQAERQHLFDDCEALAKGLQVILQRIFHLLDLLLKVLLNLQHTRTTSGTAHGAAVASSQTLESLLLICLSSFSCCTRHGSTGRAQAHMQRASSNASKAQRCTAVRASYRMQLYAEHLLRHAVLGRVGPACLFLSSQMRQGREVSLECAESAPPEPGSPGVGAAHRCCLSA